MSRKGRKRKAVSPPLVDNSWQADADKFERMLKLEVSPLPNVMKLTVFRINLNLEVHISRTNMSLCYSENMSQCLLYWEEQTGAETQVKFTYGNCGVPYEVLNSLAQQNVFNLVWMYRMVEKIVLVMVFIKKSAFFSLSYAAQPVSYRSKKYVKVVMRYFFGVSVEEFIIETYNKEIIFPAVFKKIKNCYNPERDINFSHKFLVPKLRPYQSQAVEFMLQHEMEKELHNDEIHTLYTDIVGPHGLMLWYQKYGGFFVDRKFLSQPKIRGGILADDMGLGKTVEVIACILLNPRKDDFSESNKQLQCENKDNGNSFFECVCGGNDYGTKTVMCIKCGLVQHPFCILSNSSIPEENYICPYCLVNSPKYIVKSRATLIVTPFAILQQWQEEIAKHVKKDSLKIFAYTGVSNNKFIHPMDFEDYDIVLVAYETLRCEINHIKLGKDKQTLRHRKKFRSIPSPLLTVEWWRVCLDEAQMVDSVTAKVSQIAVQLHSVNRWCVTGTPAPKSYYAFYGLFLFLGLEPYNVKEWFDTVMWKPLLNGNSENLVIALKEILWRTEKNQIIDQIKIPPQVVIVHKLELSPVEKIFYDHTKMKCLDLYLEGLRNFDCGDTYVHKLERNIVARVLSPFRRLQSSCYTVGELNKRRMTMPELNDHMIKITVNEAEELHRKLILAMNGEAAIFTIQKEYVNAAEIYRKVLKSAEDNNNNIRTDALQQIHALYNYSELMRQGHISIADDYENLNKKYEELNESYVSKYKSSAESASGILMQHSEKINGIISEFKLIYSESFSTWWIEILDKLSNEERSSFIMKLKNCLQEAPGRYFQRSSVTISDCFQDSSGLKYTLVDKWKALHINRDNVVAAMKIISQTPTAQSISSVIECHLRPEQADKKRCKFCDTDNLFLTYENELFRFNSCSNTARLPNEENKAICVPRLVNGIHADSELELFLKFCVNFSRIGSAFVKYTEEGLKELELFDTLKKEFKALRNLWLKSHDYIAALDELEMAKMTIRLLHPDETPPKHPVSYIVEPDKVSSTFAQFQSDALSLHEKFKKKLGKLFYLKNLKNADSNEDSIDESCPVCHDQFQNSWYMLLCGHTFCYACINRIASLLHNTVSCPICREDSKFSTLYHVERQKSKEDDIEVKGRYSTKMSAVVRCLLKINQNSPGAKSIVFSEFREVLFGLQQSLEENGVASIRIVEKKHLHANLHIFKTSPDINILLILVRLGANGLNIIEATNVLLVEPFLFKAIANQAIGRIHRIGQTKETTVHQFITLDSVDEKLYRFQEMESARSGKVKAKDLVQLFE